MNEYLLLFRGDSNTGLSPEASQAHMQRWMLWMKDLAENGKFVGAQPLNSTGKIVSGTRKLVTDGPFMEGKEMVGGYLICKADSYEAATEIAKNCPILESENGHVEVRIIGDMKI